MQLEADARRSRASVLDVESLLRERLAAAVALRRALGLPSLDTDTYRMCNRCPSASTDGRGPCSRCRMAHNVLRCCSPHANGTLSCIK